MTLVESVNASVKRAGWLKDTDRALIDVALTYAERVDQGAAEFAEGDISSSDFNKVLYLLPHLTNTLRALGCAPAERKALEEGEPVGGKLAQLRSLKGGKTA